MRPRTAGSLACRIIALWLGVNAVIQAVSAIILTDGRIGSLGQFWAVVGTRAAVAWLLWITATALGGTMAPDGPGDPPVSRTNADVHGVALSVVGVVLIVEAIPTLIAITVSGPDIGPFGPLSLPGGDFGFFDRSAGLVENLVKMALGLGLVLRARDLSRWLDRRNTEPPSAATGDPPRSDA